MIDLSKEVALPERVAVLLTQFDVVRGRREDKGWVVPHPGRVDNNPSVWITLTADKILIRDRTGGSTDAILNSIGWDWRDLYAKKDEEDEFEAFLEHLRGEGSHVTATTEIEGIDSRHLVYSMLLDVLTLSEAHRENLRGRGLTDQQIDQYQYRTLAYSGRGRAVTTLRERLGGIIATVPGFVADGDRITMPRVSGILIPVRIPDGRIAAIKLRQDHDSPRYLYLSGGGGSVAALAHFPLGFTPAATVAVTEGELKADITAAQGFELPILAVPGVTNWRLCLPWLRQLGVRTVATAFDRVPDGSRVAQPEVLAEFEAALWDQGYEVEEVQWAAIQESTT